jgi:DNA-binding transcriptional regulator YiaG
MSFREQMRRSMSELQSIVERGESPSGNGRFTVKTLKVVQPGKYDAKAVRITRQAMNVSQAVFAELLGVSAALVRAWELGTRAPSPMARRLFDQVHANPAFLSTLVRPAMDHSKTDRASRRVA